MADTYEKLSEIMWRDLSIEERQKYEKWLLEEAVQRQTVGRQKYGDVFQGDPLQHLKEELLDALFYCWVAMRQRSAVELENVNLTRSPDDSHVQYREKLHRNLTDAVGKPLPRDFLQ